jgi:ABC-type polysaccharide/polyol phosphate export permease
VHDGVNSIVSRERLIKQIYFPKLVLPVATTMAGVVSFAFGPCRFRDHAAVLPGPRVGVMAAGAGRRRGAAGVLAGRGHPVAATNVFYRDVGNLARHLLRLWFYLSPALYPAELVADLTKGNEVVATIFALNPWTILFGAYRDLVFNGQAPDWAALAALLLVSALLVLVAVFLFKRAEPSFAKVL